MNYEVTIGIPVYNVEKYVRESLESALAQTFPSIEFLICDDCGIDSSIDIVRELKQNHLRGKDIRIVRQPQNMGIGEARNRIIDEAQGRYLFFLDADDEIVPHAIQLLFDNAQEYSAQMVYGSYDKVEMYKANQQHIRYCYPLKHFLGPDEWPTFVYQKYGQIQAMVWNVLIDLKVIRANRLRFKSLNYWEDMFFTMDLPTYIDRAVLLPDVTYHYCCRSGSASHFQQRSHIDKREIQVTIQALEEVKSESDRIRQKSYFPLRMQKIMLTGFYIVTSIMRNGSTIEPAFTKREMRDVMKSPLTITDILRFNDVRISLLFFHILGQLHPMISVLIMRILGKLKHLV